MKSLDWEKLKIKFLKEVKLEKHPQKDWAWVQAWDKGHPGGSTEVLAHLRDLSKMLLEEK